MVFNKVFCVHRPSNIGLTISINRFLNSSWSIRVILKHSSRNIEIKIFVIIKVYCFLQPYRSVLDSRDFDFQILRVWIDEDHFNLFIFEWMITKSFGFLVWFLVLKPKKIYVFGFGFGFWVENQKPNQMLVFFSVLVSGQYWSIL